MDRSVDRCIDRWRHWLRGAGTRNQTKPIENNLFVLETKESLRKTKQTVESEEKQCLEDLGTKRISRNAICPRTGKKYKRCCGNI